MSGKIVYLAAFYLKKGYFKTLCPSLPLRRFFVSRKVISNLSFEF